MRLRYGAISLSVLIALSLLTCADRSAWASWPHSSLARSGSTRLFVAPSGSNHARCTRSRPCRSIGRAVALAHPGDQIDVAPGSYFEQVTITKRLTIDGLHAPVIDAEHHGRGVIIVGPAAAGTVIKGLIVENATYEGILALRTTRVRITNNVVQRNDRGFFRGDYVGECAWNGQPPTARVADLRAGGCGEAIHLASTSDSEIINNLVTDNTGGIYLTDESGPAARNLIAADTVIANLYDCGITLASHSRRAVRADGSPRRGAGGVYDNVVRGNIASFNGVRVPGAGILVAAAFPGSAAYGNHIIANVADGNGLPGVALHAHDLREDLNDNVIRANVIGRNAVGGARGGPGDGDGGVTHTVGILVWSRVTKLTRLEIADNHISNDYFGVWTQRAPRMAPDRNTYKGVKVPLTQH